MASSRQKLEITVITNNQEKVLFYVIVIVFSNIAEESMQQTFAWETCLVNANSMQISEKFKVVCISQPICDTWVSAFVCPPQVDSPVSESQPQLTSCLYHPAIISSAKVSSSYPPTSSVNPTIVLLQHSRGKYQPLNISCGIKNSILSIKQIKKQNAFMV